MIDVQDSTGQSQLVSAAYAGTVSKLISSTASRSAVTRFFIVFVSSLDRSQSELKLVVKFIIAYLNRFIKLILRFIIISVYPC